MTERIKIGLVGVGKIARDQHLPALAADERYELVTAASPHATVDGIANFTTIEQMIAETAGLQAVVLCTPPRGRRALAQAAISAGLHVMLEKPPGCTVSEVHDLATRAMAKNVSLFTTWHSREAAAVETARRWLTTRAIRAVRIAWQEDVRVWHGGQSWIWQPGGLGVFDAGINALSILTRILSGSIVLESAALSFPANCEAPIAANLHLTYGGSVPIEAVFDFRQSGVECWNIEVDTDAGPLVLSGGGTHMHVNGMPVIEGTDREYPALYERFAQLVAARECAVDVSPLQLVADAFLCARRVLVERFDE